MPENKRSENTVKGTRRLDNPETTRDIKHDSGNFIERAKQIYLDKRAEGLKRHKAIQATADKLNCGYMCIYNWQVRFQWEKPTPKKKNSVVSDKYYHEYPSGNSDDY